MGNLTFGCCNFIVINFFLFFIHHVIPPCGISQVYVYLVLVLLGSLFRCFIRDSIQSDRIPRTKDLSNVIHFSAKWHDS